MKKVTMIVLFFGLLLFGAEQITAKKLKEIRNEKKDCLLVFMEGAKSDSTSIHLKMEEEISKLEKDFLVFTSFNKTNASDFFVQEFPAIIIIKKGIPVNSIIGLNDYKKVLKQIMSIFK